MFGLKLFGGFWISAWNTCSTLCDSSSTFFYLELVLQLCLSLSPGPQTGDGQCRLLTLPTIRQIHKQSPRQRHRQSDRQRHSQSPRQTETQSVSQTETQLLLRHRIREAKIDRDLCPNHLFYGFKFGRVMDCLQKSLNQRLPFFLNNWQDDTKQFKVSTINLFVLGFL